ncbi:MAG: hypothetical protein ABI353_13425 [Isosphaeraceae bacterium]
MISEFPEGRPNADRDPVEVQAALRSSGPHERSGADSGLQGSKCAKIFAAVVLVLTVPGVVDAEDAARPALTIRLVHPDQQLARVIALFDGSGANDPADALAAWRRASGRRLSKTLEAAISAFNPEMVQELRPLDDAEIILGFDQADGRLRWRAVLPGDDGTFAALATALALTDGGQDEPIDGIAVDRLGPPGAPLMARSARGEVVAGSREDLRIALKRDPAGPSPIGSGWIVRLDPEALAGPGPLVRRQAAEALGAVGCREVEGIAGLDGSTFSMVLSSRFAAMRPATGTLDPTWLDLVPKERTVAAIALALAPTAVDAVFAAGDRVEQANPGHEEAAPMRARLNLLALAVGVRPEVDLWPRLKGLTACVLADPSGAIDGGLLALHTVDEPSAERIAGVVAPRLARAFRLSDRPADKDDQGVRKLGRVAGRPLSVARRGPMVLLSWGESALPACFDAIDHPDHSAGLLIRSSWGPSLPRRAGAFWPGRVSGLEPALASALAGSAPVVWQGRADGDRTLDEVRWTELDALVHRFLERLPMEREP